MRALTRHWLRRSVMGQRIPVNPFPPQPITVEQAAIALLKYGYTFDQVQDFMAKVGAGPKK